MPITQSTTKQALREKKEIKLDNIEVLKGDFVIFR